jgi:hypothetical protein
MVDANNQNSWEEKENGDPINQLKALQKSLEKEGRKLKEEKTVSESWRKEVVNLR